jgi:predicted transcriptional regulator
MATITFRTDAAVDLALDELSEGESRERSAIIREAILTAAGRAEMEDIDQALLVVLDLLD